MVFRLTRRWSVVLAACGALALAGAGAAGASDSPSTPDYQGTGVIVGLHPAPSTIHATRPVVVLRHEAIAGLMGEEMEHPFIAASDALFAGLAAGDRVAFGLKSTSDALLVISLRRVKARAR